MTTKHVVLAITATVAAFVAVAGYRFYRSEVDITTPNGKFHSDADSTDVDVTKTS